MKTCYIFGALPVKDMYEKPSFGDFIIAADKGYENLLKLGITPDLIIGDFDSSMSVPKGDNVINLNVRKNDTDVGHALEWALSNGYERFIVYGASGGMLDHTMANIQLADDVIRRTGKNGYICYYGDMNFTVIRDSSFVLEKKETGRVSVFSLCDKSYNVTIKGLSYEVENITLDRFFPLGVSNSFVGKEGYISVEKGELLIIWE